MAAQNAAVAEYIDIAWRVSLAGGCGAFERQGAGSGLLVAPLQSVAAPARDVAPAACPGVCAVLDALHIDVALGNFAARVVIAVGDEQVRNGEVADNV